MVNVTIDHKQIQVPEGTTILKAAAAAGVEIPTLCFLKDLNEQGYTIMMITHDMHLML